MQNSRLISCKTKTKSEYNKVVITILKIANTIVLFSQQLKKGNIGIAGVCLSVSNPQNDN